MSKKQRNQLRAKVVKSIKRRYKKAYPGSLNKLLKICEDYGDLPIWLEDAIDFEYCKPACKHFCKKAFGGRQQICLAELLPWIKRDHNAWEEIVLLVEHLLKQAGALDREFDLEDDIYICEGYFRPRKETPNAFTRAEARRFNLAAVS